jgi:four helix bundle protein
MLRAGTAIGTNLEQAKSAHSRRDLAAKYVVGLREARECFYWLRLISTDRPALATSTAGLREECSQIIAILTATVKKLRAD